MYIYSVIITIITLILSAFPLSTTALEMESRRYILESDEVIIQNQEEARSIQKNISSLTSKQRKEFESNGYTISSKVQGLTVSIDKSILSFQTLSPNTPRSVTNNLAIISSKGYSTRISALAPLASFDEGVVLNTTCGDNCSYKNAAKWENKTEYGLGYSVKGLSTPLDFKQGKQFRAVADESKGESPSVIMRGSGSIQTEILFKIHPSDDHSKSYTTVIHLQALNNY